MRRGKAVRCATFNSSPLEERQLVTGDFSGGLAVWDVDDLEDPIEEMTGAQLAGVALLCLSLVDSVRPDNVDLYLRPQYTAEGEYLKEYLQYR